MLPKPGCDANAFGVVSCATTRLRAAYPKRILTIPMNPVFAVLVFLALATGSAPGQVPDPLPKAPEPIEAVLRLQIFLDRQLFGPGKLDGRPGEFTTKALQRY